MSPSPLATHLLATIPDHYITATQHPFLHLAGIGALPKSTLQSWLGRDRLYTQSYIHFASSLLSHVELPDQLSRQSSLNERLVEWLVGAIANVWRECKLFEDLAERWGLDISVKRGDGKRESEGVKGYEKLFREVAEGIRTGERGVWEGMVVLWGTEKCYLDAWTYAASCQSQAKGAIDEDADSGVTRKELIPNWSSSEFATFVDESEKLLNESFEEAKGDLKRAEELWGRVLDVEKVFWPDV